GDAERRRLVAIDVDVDLRARDFEVRGEILDPGHAAQTLLQRAGGRVELVAVRRLHRELIQALAHLPADANRRRILQVDFHSRDAGELRPQLLDDLASQLAAGAARLQVNDELTE